jgi:hypothetical protein
MVILVSLHIFGISQGQCTYQLNYLTCDIENKYKMGKKTSFPRKYTKFIAKTKDRHIPFFSIVLPKNAVDVLKLKLLTKNMIVLLN